MQQRMTADGRLWSFSYQKATMSGRFDGFAVDVTVRLPAFTFSECVASPRLNAYVLLSSDYPSIVADTTNVQSFYVPVQILPILEP